MATTCPQVKKNRVVNLLKKDRLSEAVDTLTPLIELHPTDFELHYLAGMLATARHFYSDAVQAFERALKLNPNHAPSLFERGLIEMALCHFRAATDFFEKARRLRYNLPQTNRYLARIRKVAKSRDVRLSTCLIVKNEEKLLPTCLKSVQAISDEIVVVDTGSSDRTVDVAREFGARVLHYEWRDDFADARNFAKSKATGDWILQIDADEELFPEDQLKVRELIHQDYCDGAFVALHCKNSATFGENQPTVHYLVRLYRNREDFYYVNPVHEVLQYSGEVIPVDINILHHGYNLDPEILQKKRRRNATILYQKFEKDPDNIANNFYLSMLHLANREFDLCERFARRALEKSKPENPSQQHIHLMSLNNLALVHLEKGEYEPAKEFARRALSINDNYIDPMYFLGLAYFRENDYEKAKETFHIFLEKHEALSRKPVFNLFITSAHAYVFQVYHLLGKIYRREGAHQKAQEMFSKAVQIQPSFWLGYADLGYLLMDLEKWQAAAKHLEKAVELAKASQEVTRKHSQLWADFSNLLRIYAFVLKKLLEQRKRKV